MIKLLVVDDSAVVRMKVRSMLASAEDVEVVDSAPNGRAALEMVERHRPDAMLLDLEMPILDGISTLRRLRAVNSNLPVLVFSSRTSVGAPATIDALAAGASDFIAKPSARTPNALADLRADLLRKLRAITAPKPSAPPPPVRRTPRTTPVTTTSIATATATATTTAPGPATTRAGRCRGVTPLDLLVIASSTGGPNALAAVLSELPADLPVPVALVQHMPATFTPFLARRLDDLCPLRVWEAEEGRVLAPGDVAVAPGGRHMVLARQGAHVAVALNDDPHENSCRPAADPLFRSAAKLCGGRVLAVVLTGMGHDGCSGVRAVVDAGGQAIVQDAATSVVWGMPGAVAHAGLADAILPIGDIAREIRDRLVATRRLRPPSRKAVP